MQTAFFTSTSALEGQILQVFSYSIYYRESHWAISNPTLTCIIKILTHFPTRTFSRRLPIQITFFLKTLVASISLHLDSTGKGLIQRSLICITLQKAIFSLLDVKCLTGQHGPHSQTSWSLSPPISSLIPCFNTVHNVSQLTPTKADFSKPGRKRLIA